MRLSLLSFTILIILSSCGGRLYHPTLVKRKAVSQKQLVQNKPLIKPAPGLIFKVPSPAVNLSDSVIQPVVSVVKAKLPPHSVKAEIRAIKKEYVYQYNTIQKIQAENNVTEAVPTLKYKGWRIAGLLLFLFTGIGISLYLSTLILPAIAGIATLSINSPTLLGVITNLLLLAGLWFGAKNYNLSKRINRKGFINKLSIAVIAVSCLGFVLHLALVVITYITVFVAFYRLFEWLFTL